VSNSFLELTNIYMFQPTRLAITTKGPTEPEAAIVARHRALSSKRADLVITFIRP
jgi:hypothetical protein